MALNEHKNLQDANRHNPKGFENATNDSVLSKGEGTSATGTDGTLHYVKKDLLGVQVYRILGHTTNALTNYAFGEDQADNKAPYQMDSDYNHATVSAGSISPRNVLRIGQGLVIPIAATVQRIKGWIASDGTNAITLAICKVVPVANDTSVIVPTVIDEIAVTGLGHDSKLIAIDETTITSPAITAGDIIFPMIKEVSGGSSIFFNITLETNTF